jgi:EmrB/QacA subfamily drug resistance transporter
VAWTVGGYVTRWRPSQERVVLVTYAIGLYMTIVDNTIIYTALPSLARDFHTSLASAQWVTLSYLIMLAVMIPASGWIGDRFGSRRTFLSALALFTVASALCGVSGSLPELIVFRVIQGVGGGLIIPVGQAMLFRTFPPERRARAVGMLVLGTSLGPAVGPVLGGVLTTFLSWRWCFFVNVPFGTAALIIGVLFLAEHREPAAGRLDVPGFVLAGSGLALFLYTLSQSPVHGWTSPLIIATGVASVVALTALALVELRSAAPMLNLRLLRNRIFRSASLVSMCSMGAYSAYLFTMPEFLQQARGASALSSGLTTFPGALGVLASSQLAARAYPRLGPRRMAVGGACAVIAVWTLIGLTVGLDTNIWLIRLLIFCSGFSIPWCSIAVQTSSFATISSADTGRAAALFQAQGQVAAGIGVALLVTVISASSRAGDALVTAFHHAFLTAAALMVLAALIALTIKDADATSTMRRREPVPAAPVPTLAEVSPGVQEGTADPARPQPRSASPPEGE